MAIRPDKEKEESANVLKGSDMMDKTGKWRPCGNILHSTVLLFVFRHACLFFLFTELYHVGKYGA